MSCRRAEASNGAPDLTDLAMPAPERQSQARLTALAQAITLERLLWAVLILLAIWTRFWDLGHR